MTTPQNDRFISAITGLSSEEIAKRRAARARAARRTRAYEFTSGAVFGLVGLWLLSRGIESASEHPGWALGVMVLGAFFLFCGVVLTGDLK